jgi:hypothetical protein
MMRFGVAVVIALTASGASAQFAGARLRLDGFGSVRIGMTEAQARAAIDDLAIGTDREVDPGCYFLSSPRDRSVSFMVERGTVVRTDIDDPHHWTLSGVHIGSTEREAHDAYGVRLRVEPHKYDPTGHYLIFEASDRKSALVLETDGKRVTSMRAGVKPAVEYVERCG